MTDHDRGKPKLPLHRHDQIVNGLGHQRIQPRRRLIEQNDLGSITNARANPARLRAFMESAELGKGARPSPGLSVAMRCNAHRLNQSTLMSHSLRKFGNRDQFRAGWIVIEANDMSRCLDRGLAHNVDGRVWRCGSVWNMIAWARESQLMTRALGPAPDDVQLP